MSVHFRRAVAGDAPIITDIINAAYKVEAFFKNGPRTDLVEISALARGPGHFIVACDEDGTILGNVRLTVHGGRGHFGMLAVRPELKGRGVGAQLIAEAEREAMAAGCDWMDLEIVNLRTELPAYYGRFGYEVSGAQPWPDDHRDRITQPAHFILMSRPLTRTANGVSP